MATTKLTTAELRRIERISNDFDEWASQRTACSIREVSEAVSLSIIQQMVRAGYTREQLARFFEIMVDNALDPVNAAVFVADGAKGQA